MKSIPQQMQDIQHRLADGVNMPNEEERAMLRAEFYDLLFVNSLERWN